MSGCYFAENTRYSTRYTYRTSDIAGQLAAKDGRYHHILVVQVVCGVSKRETKPWPKKMRPQGRLALRNKQDVYEYDSVCAGPFEPRIAFPGEDDSIFYVTSCLTRSLLFLHDL